jgi:lipid A 3-O-deacylase
MIRRLMWVVGVLCVLSPAAALSQQEAGQTFHRFSFNWENDVFARTDRDYSNGLKMTWSTGFNAAGEETKNLPGWIYGIADRLPRIKDPAAHRALSVSLGQSIYTPENTKSRHLVEDDRPYAGYSYVGVGFLARKDIRMDVWELEAGLVGALSLAEQTQNTVHRLIHSPPAEGWEHQLKNELGLDVTHETKWRAWTRDFEGGFGINLIPHVGWRLGSIAIYANTGGELRFGWKLPADFGTCPIRPGCNIDDPQDDFTGAGSGHAVFGVQVFLGADGRYVLRDIFLDGNTFVDSHHVSKIPWVADLMAGIGIQYGRFRASYAYVYRTPEFEERKQPLLFGAVSLSWSF